MATSSLRARTGYTMRIIHYDLSLSLSLSLENRGSIDLLDPGDLDGESGIPRDGEDQTEFGSENLRGTVDRALPHRVDACCVPRAPMRECWLCVLPPSACCFVLHVASSAITVCSAFSHPHPLRSHLWTVVASSG